MTSDFPSVKMKIRLTVLIICCGLALNSSISVLHAFLYDNGTCTNEKSKEFAKEAVNTNGTVDDFLKSLPSDNSVLADSLCQNN